MSDLASAANDLLDLGFAVVPKRAASRAPAIRGWPDRRLNPRELGRYCRRSDVDGISFVGGHLSGNRLVLDFDGTEWRGAFREISRTLPLLSSPTTRTRSCRRHSYISCPDLPHDLTVRRFPARGADATVELRGNRSVSILPPSPRYSWIRSPFEFECPEVRFEVLHSILSEWSGVSPTYAPAAHDAGSVSFVLRPGASPPRERFQELFNSHSPFRLSWDHRNPSVRDTSLSGWDMSLASIAAWDGWTDQEIVDLLVAHRREWSGDLKLREDYYTRTLARAQTRSHN